MAHVLPDQSQSNIIDPIFFELDNRIGPLFQRFIVQRPFVVVVVVVVVNVLPFKVAPKKGDIGPLRRCYTRQIFLQPCSPMLTRALHCKLTEV